MFKFLVYKGQLESFPPDKIFLIPILLDDCRLPALRVGTTSLKDLQYYEFQRNGLASLITFIKKVSGVPLITVTSANGSIPTLTPDLYRAPSVVWSSYVGAQKWKNTPIYFKSTIFVGSAGSSWNKADKENGIYAIHPEDGTYHWFCPTSSDVNDILVTDSCVICGTDDGHL